MNKTNYNASQLGDYLFNGEPMIPDKEIVERAMAPNRGTPQPKQSVVYDVMKEAQKAFPKIANQIDSTLAESITNNGLDQLKKEKKVEHREHDSWVLI